MRLDMPVHIAANYRSAAQRARVVSELWGSENLYCPCCPAEALDSSPPNTKAIDFSCGSCDSLFQLKSGQAKLGARVVDGAFSAMEQAILADRTPNLLMLQYELNLWKVRNLVLLPHFAFTTSCLEKRSPLKATARRAGWIGCNILVSRIPADLHIRIVNSGVPVEASEVREQYVSVSGLAEISPIQRGWTVDVLNILRRLGARHFTLADVYAHESELMVLHPNNQHIRDKIRQQLQRLRDLGFVRFLGSGSYELLPTKNK